MRNIVTSVLEVAGLVSVAVGAFLFSVPAGFVVAGLFAVGVGYLWGGENG